MSLIYLIRHGQTDWNKEKIFRGLADRPLDETGLTEAKAVAKFLANEPIKFMYASPLKRTLQTAQPLVDDKGLKIETHQGLIDLNFGEWQGLPLEEVKRKYAKDYDDFIKRPDKARFPGGETLAQAQERAMAAVREVANIHPYDTLALVTHRVICKVIILGLLGLDVSRFWEIGQDTACINLFEYSPDRVVIRYINESCHIRSMRGDSFVDF